MKNRWGFIPSKYRQPDYYKQFFSNWAAVYLHNGKEYHVQLASRPYSRDNADSIEILQQTPTCRRAVSQSMKTIKAAMERLEKIIGKEAVS